MQLLVQLLGLSALAVELLDLIADLDAFKMLPRVKQQAAGHRRSHRHATPEILHARRSRRPRKARVIDLLDREIFRDVAMRKLLHRPLPARRPSRQFFPATRIFALRDRGFARISSSPGMITLRVSTRKLPSRSSC